MPNYIACMLLFLGDGPYILIGDGTNRLYFNGTYEQAKSAFVRFCDSRGISGDYLALFRISEMKAKEDGFCELSELVYGESLDKRI